MKDETKIIEDTMDSIPVPSEKLDSIIENSFKSNAPSRKRTGKKLAGYVLAATLAISILGGTILLNPAMANMISQLPVIGNVFDYFGSTSKPAYKEFGQLATDVGRTAEDKGVLINIDQGVFDGTTITLAVTVQTTKNYGSTLFFNGWPSVEGESAGNAGASFEKVKGLGYAGIITITPQFFDTPDEVDINWVPEMLFGDKKEVKGDWKLNFSLPLIEPEVLTLNKQVEKDGVAILFKEVRKTPLTFNIYYQQLVDPALLEDDWTAVEAELKATDDLGNEYEVPYNGGFTDGGARTREDLQWSATIHNIDPLATKLIFHPFATVSTPDGAKKIYFEDIEVEL
ncbi:DUF4179 domain-containing protein [Sporosarcina luteola]|uniref:DUF4179 domain-containing protein n=1 Tax=Sporosarcina luteola TaxID=582850 RepID=UPI00203CBB97|nr:DUF4179 domain-containing protein [Sporosarcina luteola]MCM3744619.1 DUF4179 domain-containing protein [Sporosarcina luteola]